MKLYSFDLSPYAARTRMAIRAKGLDIAIEAPDGGTRTPGFLALNPMGKVPTLVLDDGTAIPESQVVCAYLEDAFPTPSLGGTDPRSAARIRLIERIVDLYLAPAQTPIYLELAKTERDPQVFVNAIEAERKAYGYVEHYMDADGPYLAGPDVTLADCALIPFLVLTLGLARPLRRENPLDGLPRIAAYWDRVSGDPLVADVATEIRDALLALKKPR